MSLGMFVIFPQTAEDVALVREFVGQHRTGEPTLDDWRAARDTIRKQIRGMRDKAYRDKRRRQRSRGAR